METREIVKVKFLSDESSVPNGKVDEYPYFYSDLYPTKLEIISAIVEFYLIEELIINFPTNIFLMERKKFSDLFISLVLMRNDLSRKLARVLFDYLCTSSLGESRHAASRSSGYYIEYNNSYGRETVYEGASRYSPAKILPNLLKVFETGNWAPGYGGEKWAQIVKAAMLYEKVSDQIFIDHIIDLAHNGGTAFDKGYLIQLSDRGILSSILDTKFSTSSIKNLIEKASGFLNNFAITPQLKALAIEVGSRFLSRHLLEKLTSFKCRELCFPLPVKWGNRELPLLVNNKKPLVFNHKQPFKELPPPEFHVEYLCYKQAIFEEIHNLLYYYKAMLNFDPETKNKYCEEAQKKLDAWKLMKKELKKQGKNQMSILDKILENEPTLTAFDPAQNKKVKLNTVSTKFEGVLDEWNILEKDINQPEEEQKEELPNGRTTA